MQKVPVALVLFHDDRDNILLQDRREMSKWGEEYGFFGGHVEEGETPEQAAIREIKEELGIKMKDLSLFKEYSNINKEINKEYMRSVFLARLPKKSDITVTEGKAAFMKFKDTTNLKMMHGHVELLKEIHDSLQKS